MQGLVQHIDQAWASKQPFLAYHKPDDTQVHCFFPEDVKLRHLQSYDEAGFIFSPFEISSPPIVFPEVSSEVLKFELIEPGSESQSKFSIKQPPEEKEKYLNLLSKAIEQIKAKEFKKIVVSRKISADYDLQDPAGLFLKLIQFYPEAFTYVWFHPEVGFWAGASPEVLVKTYRSQLETMSLAGTKRMDEGREWTLKEQDEQQIVTDEIENALAPHVSGLNISETKTDKAGELLHLRTDIKACFETSQLGPILKALHPTPAVCGLPKEKAYQFLRANEAYSRQFYTGFFGELNMPQHNQRSGRTKNQENQAYKSIVRTSNLFVNLRCLSYADGKINIYVGGGITKDSDPEEEWAETVNKSRTMLKVL
ncbi:chorismate-binding protein [Psychroflexus montanilacus]|uniref:chorismate-binding protein n=1 Tax=Psychroflexus montanilacus TaxID=2873598 RepID=UPI001CCB3878|nr:chorismate-binding protein [Psychroflexus montanilacus]MBZ9651143.1 chorismate-binding protein [Psychroflexus montanilacus]